MRFFVAVALILLLGCGLRGTNGAKVSPKTPEGRIPKRFEDIRFVMQKYGLQKSNPDLWEAVNREIELSPVLCSDNPEDCERLYQILRRAALKGIEITRLMEEKR